jgi:chromosome segregation ATPase
MVKRYDISYPVDGGGDCSIEPWHREYLEETDDGEWVTAEDYERDLTTEREQHGIAVLELQQQVEAERERGERWHAAAKETMEDLAAERERVALLQAEVAALEESNAGLVEQHLSDLEWVEKAGAERDAANERADGLQGALDIQAETTAKLGATLSAAWKDRDAAIEARVKKCAAETYRWIDADEARVEAEAEVERLRGHLQFISEQPCGATEEYRHALCTETDMCLTEYCLPCYALATLKGA